MKIFFSGYFGFNNLGDEALLKIEVENLKKSFPNADFFVLSDTETELRDVKRIGRKNFLLLYRLLDKDAIFITGGGGVLQDKTSLRSLLYYTSLLKLASHKGAITVMFANGVGPFVTSAGAKIAGQAVNLCRYISTRDPVSKETLIDLGIPSGRIRLSADPIFTLSSEKSGKQERKNILAVSLRNSKADIIGSVCRAISVFCLENKLEPVLLPMQPQTDLEICEKASRLTGGTVRVPKSAEELIGFLETSRAAIGQRLHFSLCAMLANTPSVALAYDSKIENVLHYAGAECEILPEYSGPEDILTALRRIERSETAAQSIQKMRSLALSDASELAKFISEAIR